MFKQTRLQDAPNSGPLLMKKPNVFAQQLNLHFTTNPVWPQRSKEQYGITFKNICGKSRELSQANDIILVEIYAGSSFKRLST